MSTLGTMIDRIADELGRDNISTQIQRSIKTTIARYERERFWSTEQKWTASTADGTQSYTMPDSSGEGPLIYADKATITVNSQINHLERKPHSVIIDLTTNTSYKGIPRLWSYFQDAVWLYPIPNAVMTLTLYGVRQLTALSATTDTNFWMVEAEALIRSGAKADLFAHVIRNYDEATAMKALEREEYLKLRGENDQRILGEVRGWL